LLESLCSSSKIVSPFEARKVFRILVLLSGDVLRKNSFFFSGEEFRVSTLGAGYSLVFLCGEGEIDLLRSNTFSGEEFLDCADLSRALVTVSSVLSFADLEGECSLIRVGFPGPIVMYVLVTGSSVTFPSLYLVPEQLRAVLLTLCSK